MPRLTSTIDFNWFLIIYFTLYSFLDLDKYKRELSAMDEITYQKELRKAKRRKAITDILVLLSVIALVNFCYYIISLYDGTEYSSGLIIGISIIALFIGILIIKNK